MQQSLVMCVSHAADEPGHVRVMQMSPAAASPSLDPPPEARLRAALNAGCGEVLAVAELGALFCACQALAGCRPTVLQLSGERGAASAAAALRFFEPGVADSPRFASVTVLRVQFCDGLGDRHLRVLPKQLTELSLDCCQKVTDAGVKAAVERCGPTLERLSLYWNVQLTNAAAIAVGCRCPRLRAVCFSGCKKVGSAGVRALAARGGTLEALDVTRLPLLASDALAAVVGKCAGLRELRLYACSQLDDAPLLALASGGRGGALRTLDCTGLGQLSDGAVAAVARACPRLRELWLSWAGDAGDGAVCAVAESCAALELLSLHGLKRVGPASLDALGRHCRRTLRALDVRGCSGLPAASREPDELRRLLPRLTTFALAK